MLFPVKNSKKVCDFTFTLILMAFFTSQVVGQTGIQWEKDLDKAKARAIAEKKPLLLHFYGDSCPPCQLMERDVFPNSQVIEKLNTDFVAVKIDTSLSPQMMAPYGVRYIPADVFLSPTGEKLHVREGKPSVHEFVVEMNSIAAKFSKPQPVLQTQVAQTAQTVQNSGTALVEYNQPGFQQPFNTGQTTDFSGYSLSQTPPFQQVAPSVLNESEGYAISGKSNVNQENANVTAQLQQLQATMGSIPIHQSAQPAFPPQFPQQQFTPPQFQVEQQFSAAQPIQPTTPQQTAEPQSTHPLLSQPPFIAAAPPAVPAESLGTFQQGVIRRQPATGLGAGNSLGVVAAVSETPQTVQMPTIALDGYCPVSLAQTAKWVKGNVEITTEYEGVLFRFASVEARNTFANNPGFYAPVLRGNDAVELLTNRREVIGQRKFGAWYHGQVFLFTSAENYEKFQNNPGLYAFQTQQSANALAAAHSPMN